MSKTHCIVCDSQDDARSMELCPDCLSYVCNHCYDHNVGRCANCASVENL